MTGTGFGGPQPPARYIKVWFSIYGRGDEDTTIALERVPLPLAPGQSLEMAAVRHARTLLARTPEAHEVIAHRGPHAVPQRGDDVLARVCREPFRHSHKLP